MYTASSQQQPLCTNTQYQQLKYTTTPNGSDIQAWPQSQQIGNSAATNAIEQFNAYTVFLDGNDGVQTLQQIYLEEQQELQTRPLKAKLCCALTVIIFIVGISGVILWLLNCSGQSCTKLSSSVKLVMILFALFACCACAFTIYHWNRGRNTWKLFAECKNERDALHFDLNERCIKKIVFWVDYGLPDRVRKMSRSKRNRHLHEGVVTMEGLQLLCSFSHVQEIGWSVISDEESDVDYYILLNYFDTTTQKIVTFKSDLAETKYDNERVFEQLQDVMKAIDPMWLEKIQVSNRVKKKRWYKKYDKKNTV